MASYLELISLPKKNKTN